ncbi:hypothetical protein ACLOJK_038896, partial [Asimina triloba]
MIFNRSFNGRKQRQELHFQRKCRSNFERQNEQQTSIGSVHSAAVGVKGSSPKQRPFTSSPAALSNDHG